MKSLPYFIILLLSVVCVALSVSLVLTSRANQRLQVELQANQQRLNSGILGPQGQQIGNNLLQDMATTATRNADMRQLLAKHGYQIQPATNSVASAIGTSKASDLVGQGEKTK
ncbi:MAG: hypothetical protein WCP12_16420 [bacterium]